MLWRFNLGISLYLHQTATESSLNDVFGGAVLQPVLSGVGRVSLRDTRTGHGSP